jgi:hypothetical protein
MTTPERNFATFEFAEDDPYQLAGGLLTELADRVKVDLTKPEGPSDLVATFGKKETLRTNDMRLVKEAISLQEAADYVEQSGIMEPLNRSLWTPNLVADVNIPIFMTGAVANWQDRTSRLVSLLPGSGKVHAAVGNRLMDTPTEAGAKEPVEIVGNERIGKYKEKFDMLPTEALYFDQYITPELEARGRQVVFQGYSTGKGDEIARRYIKSKKGAELLEQGVMVARVANAGLQLALQLRKEARSARHGFDSQANPDMYIITDGLSDEFEIARTAEQASAANAARYQNPYTALRQVAVTGKLLSEARAAE